VRKIIHYFETLGSDGIGEKTIEALVETGHATLPQFYLLNKADILELEGFADHSAELLLAEIRRVHTQGVSLARFLHAIDIFNGKFGEKILQKIIDSGFMSFSEGEIQLNPSIENYYNHLVSIEGISDITAKVFLNNLEKVHRNEYMFIMDKINLTQIESIQKTGIKVCFTGVRPSSEIKERMANAGFQESDSVSKDTKILVVKDLASSSSKMNRAKELGIEIMSLEQFISEKLV
jgi:DNA ligase (NAD+)